VQVSELRFAAVHHHRRRLRRTVSPLEKRHDLGENVVVVPDQQMPAGRVADEPCAVNVLGRVARGIVGAVAIVDRAEYERGHVDTLEVVAFERRYGRRF